MCISPINVKVKETTNSMPVPCGRCEVCLKRRVSGWSFRLMMEDKASLSSHFITLTYDTKHVPITRNGFMEIKKRDLQLFFKRLRKQHGNISDGRPPIKYYAVGEYGGKTMRPHYHIILFNVDVELVQPAWELGSVHYGSVSGASVGYCLKYMMKKSRIPMHRNDDRLREFSLMSKRLGANYLTDEMLRWHKESLNDRMCLVLGDGRRVAMPRYYKDKVYTKEERSSIGVAVREQLEIKALTGLQKGALISYRDRAAAVKASYKRMHEAAESGRNKI